MRPHQDQTMIWAYRSSLYSSTPSELSHFKPPRGPQVHSSSPVTNHSGNQKIPATAKIAAETRIQMGPAASSSGAPRGGGGNAVIGWRCLDVQVGARGRLRHDSSAPAEAGAAHAAHAIVPIGPDAVHSARFPCRQNPRPNAHP